MSIRAAVDPLAEPQLPNTPYVAPAARSACSAGCHRLLRRHCPVWNSEHLGTRDAATAGTENSDNSGHRLLLGTTIRVVWSKATERFFIIVPARVRRPLPALGRGCRYTPVVFLHRVGCLHGGWQANRVSCSGPGTAGDLGRSRLSRRQRTG